MFFYFPTSFWSGMHTKLPTFSSLLNLLMLTFMRMFACLYSHLQFTKVKHDVMTFAEAYDFVITKDWWDIKELPLCYGFDNIITFFDKNKNKNPIHFSLIRYLLCI